MTASEAEMARKPWVWPVRIVIVMVTLLLLAAGATAVAAEFFVRRSSQTTSIPEPVRRLQISDDTGDVRIRTIGSGDSTVTSRRTSAFRDPVIKVSMTEGTLGVEVRCPGGFGFADRCSVDLVVRVPSGIPVEVGTGSGDIDAAGPAGAVSLVTGSGDVRFRGVADSLTLRSGSGDVDAEDLRAGRVQARSGSGDVTVAMRSAPSEVTVKTGSGDVAVRVPDDGISYQVRTDVGSGDTEVRVPTSPSSGPVISASTGSGDVSVTLATTR
jgi:hypothetical protein